MTSLEEDPARPPPFKRLCATPQVQAGGAHDQSPVRPTPPPNVLRAARRLACLAQAVVKPECTITDALLTKPVLFKGRPRATLMYLLKDLNNMWVHRHSGDAPLEPKAALATCQLAVSWLTTTMACMRWFVTNAPVGDPAIPGALQITRASLAIVSAMLFAGPGGKTWASCEDAATLCPWITWVKGSLCDAAWSRAVYVDSPYEQAVGLEHGTQTVPMATLFTETIAWVLRTNIGLSEKAVRVQTQGCVTLFRVIGLAWPPGPTADATLLWTQIVTCLCDVVLDLGVMDPRLANTCICVVYETLSRDGKSMPSLDTPDLRFLVAKTAVVTAVPPCYRMVPHVLMAVDVEEDPTLAPFPRSRFIVHGTTPDPPVTPEVLTQRDVGHWMKSVALVGFLWKTMTPDQAALLLPDFLAALELMLRAATFSSCLHTRLQVIRGWTTAVTCFPDGVNVPLDTFVCLLQEVLRCGRPTLVKDAGVVLLDAVRRVVIVTRFTSLDCIEAVQAVDLIRTTIATFPEPALKCVDLLKFTVASAWGQEALVALFDVKPPRNSTQGTKGAPARAGAGAGAGLEAGAGAAAAALGRVMPVVGTMGYADIKTVIHKFTIPEYNEHFDLPLFPSEEKYLVLAQRTQGLPKDQELQEAPCDLKALKALDKDPFPSHLPSEDLSVCADLVVVCPTPPPFPSISQLFGISLLDFDVDTEAPLVPFPHLHCHFSCSE